MDVPNFHENPVDGERPEVSLYRWLCDNLTKAQFIEFTRMCAELVIDEKRFATHDDMAALIETAVFLTTPYATPPE
jgi:hypothetical protein